MGLPDCLSPLCAADSAKHPKPEAPFSGARDVRAAINRLSPTHAATIRLFYLEEYSLREVAAAMDVPQGTVKSRLSQARNLLKNHLKGHENA